MKIKVLTLVILLCLFWNISISKASFTNENNYIYKNSFSKENYSNSYNYWKIHKVQNINIWLNYITWWLILFNINKPLNLAIIFTWYHTTNFILNQKYYN